ncbi:tetratricopeptide repeat protein [Tropicimonas marinistellae]|uniref:tetratricopeptide repeat protein n=1 Tax=Tropicimonas marinistellae TaxID=1739787 RepID=UPI000836DCC8|nr:SEL1-like repeat protein [Tropicimonas marinistellae]
MFVSPHRLRSALLAGALSVGSVCAAPVEIDFRPPDIKPMDVCVSRPADGVIFERWKTWDGGAFFTDDIAVVKADLSRLEMVDAPRWEETLKAAYLRLRDEDPKYTETHALLDRIELMIATGRYGELERQRLVPELLRDIESKSPRFQNAAAEFLMDGVGVPRDPARASEIMVASAYAGNADAILALTARVQRGEIVPGWDLDPELAITMAFGSLVGELNSTICDRIWRIAREFKNGEIVAQSNAKAERWYRFAADLGDGAAAWKVVEFHLKSDGFEKDNDTLLHYLTQASDHGLTYAMVELGGLYERGAIVPKDLEKARSLYKAALEPGQRQGLVRYALFLEAHQKDFPGHEAERLDALRQLSELDEPPGWVFTRLATGVLKAKGQWAGEADARVLLERAAELGDTDGLSKLAEILFHHQDNHAATDRALDLLTRAVTHHGSISAMNDLSGAYMCRTPDAPRLDLARHWKATEAGTDSSGLDLSINDTNIATVGTSALEEAVLQTQALYGRPSSLAVYLTHLQTAGDVDPVTLEFWARYSRNFDSALSHLARISFELAATDNERWSALQLMREAMKRGEAESAIRLAEILLRDTPDDTREEAWDLLSPLAGQGSGDAINLMLHYANPEDSAGTMGEAELFARFAEVIDARGDFQALAFALPRVDASKRQDYIHRMKASMTCDFKSAVRFSEALSRIGRRDEARHWLDTASNLADDTPWKLVKMGDSYRDSVGVAASAEMMSNYIRAWEAGSSVARYRLIDRYTTPAYAEYDPDAAAAMFLDAFATLEDARLASVLGRLRGSTEAVQAAVSRHIDLIEPYGRAAASGDVAAMREYGYFLRDRAEGPEAMRIAVSWIEKAAQGGDPSAMFELSRAYAFGIGVPADAGDAATWLRQAAVAGHGKAAELAAQANLLTDIHPVIQ